MVVIAVAFVAERAAEASTLLWLLKVKWRRRGMAVLVLVAGGNGGQETSTAVGLLTKRVS